MKFYKKIKRLLLVMLLFGVNTTRAQLTYTYTVTSTLLGGGLNVSIDNNINQAILDAQNGHHVTILFDAPGLVQIASSSLPVVNKGMGAGSITFDRNLSNPNSQGIEFASSVNNPTINAGLYINSSANVTVKNLTFNGFINPPTTSARHSIIVYDGNNISISDCVFTNGSGIYFFNACSNLSIINNTFEPTVLYSGTITHIWGTTQNIPSTHNDIIINGNKFLDPNNLYYDDRPINIQFSGPTTQITNTSLTINNNVFTQQGDGIEITDYADLTNNDLQVTATGNNFSYVPVGNQTGSYGFLLFNPLKSWVIDGNTFSGYDLSFEIQTWNWFATNPRDCSTCGFSLIANNSIGYTVFNGNNIFGNNSFHPVSIYVIGNYGNGVDIVGLDLPASIHSWEGKHSIIRANKIKGPQPINLRLNQAPQIPGNLAIASPSIQHVTLSSNSMSVDYTIPGETNAYTNYIVDFYKSNSNGDLLNYLGNATISTLTGSYTSNITIPAGFSLTYADRIAATVTGTGNVGGTISGTSEVSYSLQLPSCCSNVSLSSLVSGACLVGTSTNGNNKSGVATTCPGRSVGFDFSSFSCAEGSTFSVDYGDGSAIQTGTTTNHTYTTAGTYTINAIVNSNPAGTCVQTVDITLTVLADCCYPASGFTINIPGGDGNNLCVNAPISFNFASTKNCMVDAATQNVQWTFSTGATATGATVYQSFGAPGTYTVTGVFTIPGCATTYSITKTFTVFDCLPPCETCIGSFAPEPGEYIASVWVRELKPSNPNLFSSAEMKLSFTGSPLVTSVVATTGTKVIDGWQRLEGTVTVPPGATQIQIQLKNNSLDPANKVYFDDIRIHPFDASMKTYVYDPITLRLVAELDERNYATLYEYDEEGILIRVKKETEKGIMTIKETRQNNSK